MESMTSNSEKPIAAVIPALNEAKTIERVVAGVRQYAMPIVVDDGSTDATAELARGAGAIVISHAGNRGYEAALQTGFEKACEADYAYVITLDADGQHDPGIIKTFYERIVQGEDMVIGSRDRLQRLGEVAFSVAGRLLWGLKDPMCGVKAYSAECLRSVLSMPEFDSIGTKYAVEAIRRGYKFVELPVQTKRRADAPRFGAGWRANMRILRALKTLILLPLAQ